MNPRRNALVAALVVASVGAIALLVATPASDRAEPKSATPHAPASSDHKAAARPRAAAIDAVKPESAPELPPPVDLAHVDRDLDLHGVVVTKDGAPIAGAALRVVTSPWTRVMLVNWEARDAETLGPSTKSAQDGTFRLRLARGDDVTLRVEATGFAAVDLPHRLAGERVRVVMESGVRLIVRATDDSGAGVAGAPVRVLRGAWQGDPVFRRDATTAADGSCAFDGLPPSCAAYIEARAAGRVPVSFQKIELPATGEASAELKLLAGRTLRGRVVDAAGGGAVADARVGIGWTLTAAIATSADGSFALVWPEKGESEVHVLAPGFARAQRAVGTSEYLDIALDRGVAATGRVVDADGHSVAGALVSVVASVHENRGQRMSVGNATTDSDGRFRCADLDRAMPHRVVVVARGHARLVRKLDAAPKDGATWDLGDVALATPRTIEGRLVSTTGEPIARMPLELWGPDDRDYFHYGYNEDRATDDLGRFRFTDLAPGGYTISTKKRGESETTKDVKLAADADLLDVVITVDVGTPLTVTVVDDGDQPLSGVYVMAFGGNGMSPGAETNSSGIAQVTVRGSALQLRASCRVDDPRALLSPPMRPIVSGEREVKLVMKRGARLAGTVLDPDGNPVAGAQIAVTPANPSVGILPADESGHFSTIVEQGRTYAVVFDGMTDQGNRPKPTPWAARADDVAAGTTDLVLRCERVAQDRTFTVKVVMPDGRSPAGTRVMLLSASGAYQPTAAMGDDGRAEFTKLPARQLSAMAWPQGDLLGPLAQSVVPQGQEIVLTMRRALAITGTVVDADGKPVKGAYVRVSTGTTMHQGNDSKEDGSFRVLVPADDPGPFRVDVQHRFGTKGVNASAENAKPGEPLRVALDGR